MRGKRISEETFTAICEELAAGVKRPALVEKYGVAYATVARIDADRLAGVVRPGRRSRSKLTDEQQAALVLDYREGVLSSVDLGKKYGVSANTVQSVARQAGVVRNGGRRASESPVELVAGAWLYDANGIARWTPGAVAPATDEERAS
jgi:transposase-like protein